MLDEGIFTIEHIMPQKLNADWKKDLGENYETIHNDWLHRLANITLTAYNSSYSNSNFLHKKEMKNGYKDSGLSLNKYLLNFDIWTEKELLLRQQDLIKTALEIWPAIKTNYVPEKDTSETYTLENFDDFTGKKVTEFVLFDEVHKITSWTEFYEKVIRTLHKRNEVVLNRLALNQINNDLTILVDTTDSVFRSSIQMDKDIYINTNSNTQTKINWLVKFFELYNVELSELLFTTHDYAFEPKKSDANILRSDIIFRFWEYLLPEFKQKSSLFSNNAPKKNNWMTCSVGIEPGIQYVFAIGKKGCSVKLEFYTNDSSKNLKYYNKMLEHKSEIESRFGNTLVWDCRDNVKYKMIMAQNSDANIFEEEKWQEIRNFLISSMIRLHDSTYSILKS